MVVIEFFTDPVVYLRAAEAYLAQDPVLNTVLATNTMRLRDEIAAGVPQDASIPRWWLLVRDEHGTVVGAGMRTATFPPYPLYLLPMPEGAARELARQLYARGEDTRGLNGALPAIRHCGAELAALTGGGVRVGQHNRLFELGELVMPVPVPGRLRPAVEEDVDLALEWFVAFLRDADEQAGRPPGSLHESTEDRDSMLRRIASGRVWFWLDGVGERVQLTGANPPAFGVARIGPVYTPPDRRGRGYASAAVAEVSRLIAAGGARACLFTDQANPTSNKIYESLGYRRVVEMANLEVD